MKIKDIKKIKYFVVDIDGTLTDSGIYYDDNGIETKKFSTRDAAGFFALKEYGIKTIMMTGRECTSVKKRLLELKADYIFQNVKDKYSFLKNFMHKNKITANQICYAGDDLNDLAAMNLCGYITCPADSCKEIIEKADYISSKNGGNGAFRDIVENLLSQIGVWEQLISKIYNSGI